MLLAAHWAETQAMVYVESWDTTSGFGGSSEAVASGKEIRQLAECFHTALSLLSMWWCFFGRDQGSFIFNSVPRR